MKFGKWLKRQIEQSLPAWKDEFLSYNELKPVIGAVSPAEFVARLDVEIEKINALCADHCPDPMGSLAL